MSRVVYPARETVTEIRGEDAAEIINKMMKKEGMTQNHQTESEQIDFRKYEI